MFWKQWSIGDARTTLTDGKEMKNDTLGPSPIHFCAYFKLSRIWFCSHFVRFTLTCIAHVEAIIHGRWRKWGLDSELRSRAVTPKAQTCMELNKLRITNEQTNMNANATTHGEMTNQQCYSAPHENKHNNFSFQTKRLPTLGKRDKCHDIYQFQFSSRKIQRHRLM